MNPANGLPQQNPANDHSQKNPAYGHPQQYPAYGHPQQNPANGLLGKRLLRAPVCVAGSSAQNVRGCNLLSKSSAPYRPPHLYKMNLHSEGENKDEIDGKTFCFAECPGLESAEVERRGRGNFIFLELFHAVDFLLFIL
ncbi:CHORISMATE SYNTHASE [Salix koriyanagi]|uniref:CHORISMATE SYNTHASE n=1 Tax=Salix koriyanagi TaxID=2511006 RepID=A0A9Q0UYN7_9ROSI|nr:CHORISMATE SYNTHASE [Salix koriyanagi]